MTTTYDFVVIGAGIAGASAAYELAAHGSVVLIEQEATPGHHTTGRSAALYTEAYERGPVRLLVMASRHHLDSPPDGFSANPILTPLPMLFIATQDQLPKLDEIFEDVAGVVRLERMDEDGALRNCPVLRNGYVSGALLEPDSMEIDVHALHQGFLTGARRRGGAMLVNAPVTELRRSGASWTVTAGGETIESTIVVNAAGAWCDTVAAMAGARPLGLTPYRRTAFTFGAPEAADISGWPMVVDADEQFYFKPEGHQFMGSLAEQTPMHPHDVRPEEIDVALGVERITAATTLDLTHVRTTWAGLRTFSPDRLPVIGFDSEIAGFFWLGGQGGYGIMTSPAMSRAAAALATGGAWPEDLGDRGIKAAALAPGRPGLAQCSPADRNRA